MRLLAALRGVQLAFACLRGWKAFGLRAPNRPHKDLVPGQGLGFSLELREKLEVTQSLWRRLLRWFDDVKLEKIVCIGLMGTVCLMGAVFREAPMAPVSLVGAVLGGAPIAPVCLLYSFKEGLESSEEEG